jgi:hypothetical protein
LPEIDLSGHRLDHQLERALDIARAAAALVRFERPLPQRHIGGIVSNFGTAGSTRSQARPRTV